MVDGITIVHDSRRLTAVDRIADQAVRPIGTIWRKQYPHRNEIRLCMSEKRGPDGLGIVADHFHLDRDRFLGGYLRKVEL